MTKSVSWRWLALILALAAVLLTLGKLAGGESVTLSFADIAAFQILNGANIFRWSLLPAAAAMLLVIPCEAGIHPFDIAEAETEICEGVLCEYSGAPLAVFKLNGALKMFVMSALFTAMFLGGPGLGHIALDTLVFVLECLCVMLVSMTLPHAVCARFKSEQVFKFYWTTVAVLALTSLVMVWLGM